MPAVARMPPADLGLRAGGVYADLSGSRVSDRFRLAPHVGRQRIASGLPAGLPAAVAAPLGLFADLDDWHLQCSSLTLLGGYQNREHDPCCFARSFVTDVSDCS